ncbi:MAG TPA: hypothetical protein VET88_03560 [Gammaproteobacteria bacterium]|nr:hypothetical protein [Gammaproteobacteria bacterium]
MSSPSPLVDLYRVETSITMLKQYLAEEDITPLIVVLESIAADPRNEALLGQLSDVFDGLGLLQGAVLTYAPYISIVLAGDLFDEMD